MKCSFLGRRKTLLQSNLKNLMELLLLVIMSFLNSTKSQLRFDHIEGFKKDINIFREYFPEYNDKKVIGFFASPNPDESFI
jgi:hypothetical protein